MALSLQDIVKGLDFTGFASASAADHNTLVDSATPKGDTASEGKGFVIWTVDSALNTPIVPDPLISASYNKWKRYVWLRIPYAGATVKTPKLYGWNDDDASDATYLKWNELITDTSTIVADIAALEVDVAAVEATANTANTTAATANTAASTALNTANDAIEDAAAALAAALEPPAAGSITAAMLESSLNLSSKNVTLPIASVTAAQLAAILDLSDKTLTLPATSVTGVISGTRITSEETVISNGRFIYFAHGFATTPIRATGYLKCITVDSDYAVGDRLDVMSTGNDDGQYPNFWVGWNSTHAWLFCRSTTYLDAPNKAGNAMITLDAAKWVGVVLVEV